MRRAVMAVLAGLFAGGAAQAADDIGLDLPACYERVYDARHLAANPGQHVQSMRVRFFRHPDADTVSALMNLQFRQGSRRYRESAGTTYVASFICMRERGQIVCGVECDGGHVTLRFTGRTPADMLLDASQGFVMTGACPEEGRDERFNPRPDDRAFRLTRIAANCPIRETAGR